MTGKAWKAAAAALALVSVAGLAGCGGGAGGSGASQAAAGSKVAGVKVKIGYPPSLCQAPLIIAYEKGFYQKEGLDPEMVKMDSVTANETISAGKVDVMQTLITKTIHPWQNGLPVKAITGTHFGCVRTVVRPDSGINSVKDLKGKKIGVPGLADTGAVVLQRALRHEGIGVTPDNMEVEFVIVERNSLPQALKDGQVDAIAMTDPVGYIAEKQYGFKAVLDTATTKPWDEEYCCAVVVNDKFIQENKQATEALTRAVQEGCLYVRDHPEEAAKILADKNYIAGDPEDNAKLLKSYNYTPSVEGGYKAIESSAEDMAAMGLADQLDPKAFADNVYQRFDGWQDVKSL